MSEVGYIFPNDAAKQVVDVGKAISKTDDELIDFTVHTENLIKLLNEQGSSLGALLSHYEKVKKGTAELDKVGKQLVQSEEKLKQVQDERTKKIIENRVETQKQTKEIKDKIKASQSDKLVTEAQNGAYDKMAKSLSSNIAKWKQMTQAERDNSKEGKRLLSTIQAQDRELKKLDTQIGRSQRHVGNYGKATLGVAKNLMGAFGIVGGLAMFAKVMKDAFNTIRSFTKENAVLAGVLGKTRDEVEELTEQSIALGAVYPVTASEVTKLQVSYARLGFTMSEISNLTEATILGSIALNAELDKTATLVGAVVKAYAVLGTSDAGMIIDQLTLATQRSSLSFTSLETALPKVAGAANALNESLSGTLSKLAIAQDATLDASTAGTSLRNIYLEITKKGLTYNEALDKIQNSSNKLSTAFDLFGKRGAIVGLALADNREKAEELRKEFDTTGDVAERVAAEQMATLDGAIKSLDSSWEKTMLGFRNSEGFLSSFLRGLSEELDVASVKYATREEKRQGKNLKTRQKYRADLLLIEQGYRDKLATVSNAANQQELQELETQNQHILGENVLFDVDFLKAIENRYESLAKEQKDEIARSEKVVNDAKLVELERQREAGEKALKERNKAERKALSEFLKMDKESQEKLSEQKEKEQELELEKLENHNNKIEGLASLALNNEIEARKEANEEKTALAEEQAQKDLEIEQRRADTVVSIATNMGDSLGALASGQIETFKEFSKEIILIALDSLEKKLLLAQTAILIGDVSTKGFLGIATAAVKFGLIKAAFTATKGLVMAFNEGTHGQANTPSEFIAGDKKGGGNARELMKLRTGKVMMVNKKTHFKGNEYSGATIYSNPETEQIISQSGKGNAWVFDDSGLREDMKAVKKAIQKKPVSITDPSGRVIGKQSGNSRELYLERLTNGR